MKKSRSMRLASALLVCTLLSTCMISGTFAKYTSQDSGSDVARVAKWGVELQVAGELYGETYKEEIISNDNSEMTVQASDFAESGDQNVVAPGTQNNNGFGFKINGTPEVDSQVEVNIVTQNIFLNKGTYGIMVPTKDKIVTEGNFAAIQDSVYVKNGDKYAKPLVWDATKTYYTLEDEVTELEFSNDSINTYYPVVYKLNGTTSYDSGNYKLDSIKAVSDVVLHTVDSSANMTAVAGRGLVYKGTVTKKYEQNENLTNSIKLNDTYLTWMWNYTNDATKEGDVACVTDKADTILGQMIADCKDTLGYDVVKLNASSEYEVVKYNNVGESGNIKAYTYAYTTDVENPIACLTTQFSIDITVTQVD